MEWTKIKPMHYIVSDLTIIEHGALIRIIALTAHLERLPTPRETSRLVPQATCKALASKLQASCTPLASILDKVLEDVDGVKHKRNVSRETSNRYRKKKKGKNDVGDVSSDAPYKSIEEKSIEDKNIKGNKLSPDCGKPVEKKIDGKVYVDIHNLLAQGIKDEKE